MFLSPYRKRRLNKLSVCETKLYYTCYSVFFLDMGAEPRPLHQIDAYGHFITLFRVYKVSKSQLITSQGSAKLKAKIAI